MAQIRRKMTYPNLTFPSQTDRPFFYTNFVSTVDGKIQVTTPQQKDYWPLGSATDYQTLIELRGYADVLIHGKNTAVSHPTVQSLGKDEFKKLREKLGKEKDILYVVMTDHPDKKMEKHFKNSQGIKPFIFGSDVKKLSTYLHNNGYKNVLVEGGPHIMGSFFQEDLIDEVFLTIAPKIVGNEPGKTLSMVEGELFPPEKVKKLSIISIKQIEDELYLRYAVNH